MEPATRPTESPLYQIRAALIEAVCDGPHVPFSPEAQANKRAASDRLRDLVSAYATHLRARDVPPERAVGFIKGLVRDTEIPCGRPLLGLEAEILHWTIDAYYGTEAKPER